MIYSEKFGAFIRRKRQERELGLREMSRKMGMSPTYLSMCERGDCLPPSEERVRAIANILDHDVDELLAMAGKVSSDILDIIKRNPVEMAAIIRSMNDLSQAELYLRLTQPNQ